MAGSVRRLSGATATYHSSAFSGTIIRVREDGKSLLVQHYFPLNGKTVYTTPVVREVTFIEPEDGEELEPAFFDDGGVYMVSDFLRDDIGIAQ